LAPNLKGMRVGVSTYSWQFTQEKMRSVEHIMDKAFEFGLDGIEVLYGHVGSEEDYLMALKRRALMMGLDIYSLETRQNFVKPLKEQRQRQIDYTQRCLDVAYKLGAPAMVINSGRWETVDFDEFMRGRGIEPSLSGHTEESAFAWVVDSINKCIPAAEDCGVVMALLNHWGVTSTAERLLEVVEAVNSDWIGVAMDTGNFLEDTYDGLRKIARATVLVHAKMYFGGGIWYAPVIDYERVAAILKDINYRGYVSIVHEGREDPETAIPKASELLTSKMGIR